MFQEIELLAAIAVFLPFFAAFAYHLTFMQNVFESGAMSLGESLQHGIMLQQELNAYSVSGLSGPIGNLTLPEAADPFAVNGIRGGGRLLQMGGSIYAIGGANGT
ncbi:MAG TPA: hypothetical protein VMV00_02405 [Candidatus Baltobacteraceae bacterium]|nr:hypothetical protein [Candidatus Baltobacteraceae bacterium]